MADTELLRRIIDSEMSEQDKIIAIRAIKGGTPQAEGAQPASAPMPAAEPGAAVSSPSAAPVPQATSVIPDQAPPAQGMPEQPQQGMLSSVLQKAQDYMGSPFAIDLGASERAQRPGDQMTDMGGPTLGEAVGNLATAPLGPFVRPVGGAIGAAAGLYAARKATGRDVTAGEMALEGALSILPETLEEPARRFFKWSVSKSRRFKQVAEDAAEGIATQLKNTAFDPPNRADVDNLFSMVSNSGTKVDTSGIVTDLQGFDQKEMKRLQAFVEKLGTDPRSPSAPSMGRRLSAALEMISKGTPIDMDIGELNALRSALNKKISYGEGHPTSLDDEVFGRTVDMIDYAIDQTLAAGGKNAGTAKMLKEARGQWHRYKAADELGTLISRSPISGYTRGGQFRTFNLGALKQAIENPRNKLEQQIARNFNTIPGSKEEVLATIGRLEKVMKTIDVDVPTESIGQMLNMPRMLGTILSSVSSRRMLENMALDNKGTIPYGMYATAFNAARRAAEVELTNGDPTERLNPRNRTNY